jgi:hypothetical protein
MSHGHEPPPRRPYRRPELRELTREEAEEQLRRSAEPEADGADDQVSPDEMAGDHGPSPSG